MAAGVGECCYTTVLTPLVADLAPAGLRGRYMAVMGSAWWTGLAIAPTLGVQILGRAPAAVFAAAAAAAAACAASALTLGRRLPAAARLTPRPGGTPG
jgi:MFS family permease